MKLWITTLFISLLLPCDYISATECTISTKYYLIPSEDCHQTDRINGGELRLIATYEENHEQTIFDSNQFITITDWWRLKQLSLEGIGGRTVFVDISLGASKYIKKLHLNGETEFKFLGNIRMIFQHLEVLTFNGRYTPFRWDFTMFRNLTNLHLKYISTPNTEMEFGTTTITSNWFRGLDNLRDITISNAGITKLSKYAFTPLKNLDYLDLSENNIKHIPYDVFKGKNLSHLDLSGNGIKYVYLGSFRGLLGVIQHLKLNRNPNFPLDTLINIPDIYSIDIESNDYTIISPRLFFKTGYRIDISGNLLACSCENKWAVLLSNRTQCYNTEYTTHIPNYPLIEYFKENCPPISIFDYLCFIVKCKTNEICNNELVKQNNCKVVQYLEESLNSTSEITREDIEEDNCGCECQDGFKMDRKGSCIDIDECTLDTSKCEQTCINLEGGYECGCMSGYEISEENPYTCTCSNTYNIHGYHIQKCVPIYLVYSLRAWIVIICSILFICCVALFLLTFMLIGVKRGLDRWADIHSTEDKNTETNI